MSILWFFLLTIRRNFVDVWAQKIKSNSRLQSKSHSQKFPEKALVAAYVDHYVFLSSMSKKATFAPDRLAY